MVNWFNTLTIKWKLAVITILTTGVALLFAGAIAMVIDARTYEQHKRAEVTTTANILAANVVGAVVFEDADAAEKALSSLAANTEVEWAGAFGADGRLIARYDRLPFRSIEIPEVAPTPFSEMREDGLIVVAVPVIQANSQVGTVYLGARIESAAARMSQQALILALVGLACVGLALPASMRLHRTVTDPVEELRANSAIIQTTLENVDHGVLVADRDSKVTFLNERVAKMFGLSSDVLHIGSDLTALKERWKNSGEVQNDFADLDLARMNSSEAHRFEYRLATGTTIEYRHAPLPGGGFVRTYTDVTDQREIEKNLQAAKARAEDADRAKSAFLAAMSHEIRTPMNGVIGVIELLHATPLSPDQKQMVEIVRQSGTGLLDVINDILDYSKIEAGRMTIEVAPFAIGEILESTAKAISGHTKSKTLNVFSRIDTDIDWSLMGDSVRVRQVVLNLLGNALKFTEMGSIELNAMVEAKTDDDMTIRFEVRDTGIGIPADKMDRLFERFTQADYSTTRRFGGTGLGLSISKHLVELMDGQIGARSVEGQGSTFWFTVPFRRLPKQKRIDPFASYADTLKDVRVLVCDRTSTTSTSIAYLRAIGVDVVQVNNVGQIVEAFYAADRKGQAPDVIILKVRIGEDAISLLAAELSKRKGMEQVKVLLVLPNISASAAKSLGTSNPIATISSPICRRELYDAIASLAARSDKAVTSEMQRLDFAGPSIEEAVAKGCLLLVAEDNETNQFVIRSQLRRLGYAAEFAGDGQEAWNLIRKNGGRYGLLLTDCHMPFVDGYTLSRMIREMELETKRHLPVIALTANALEGESDLCLAAGMDDYLSKPVLLSALDDRIRKWLPRAADLRREVQEQPEGEAAAPPAPIAAPTGSAEPPIDLRRFAEMVGSDDPAYLREMLTVFWDSMSDTPDTIRVMTRNRDSQNLVQAAHAAKGAAASACATALADLCKRLELAARAERWSEIEDLSPEIADAFDEIEEFVTAELARGAEKKSA